jgi:NAD(P)-dependent dehydrogenase (short-subunit alcohol dehydrogenase family)
VKQTAESVTRGIDMSGKTALVTGATSGLGRECARVLALRGARVLIGARNKEKGEATAREIGGEACACELSSMRSMRALAGSIDRVDYVYLNGGVFGVPFELTDEGFERTYAANYLGHFLLVHELRARGALGPGARIVSTLSEGVLNPLLRVNLELVARPTERAFSKLTASPATKVLLALMAVELARRAPELTMVGVCPPATLTDNVNQGGAIVRTVGRALGPVLFKPVEEGATVLAWAAIAPDLIAGRAYGSKLRETKLTSKCTDPERARAAWEATARALGLSART